MVEINLTLKYTYSYECTKLLEGRYRLNRSRKSLNKIKIETKCYVFLKVHEMEIFKTRKKISFKDLEK